MGHQLETLSFPCWAQPLPGEQTLGKAHSLVPDERVLVESEGVNPLQVRKSQKGEFTGVSAGGGTWGWTDSETQSSTCIPAPWLLPLQKASWEMKDPTRCERTIMKRVEYILVWRSHKNGHAYPFALLYSECSLNIDLIEKNVFFKLLIDMKCSLKQCKFKLIQN